MSVSKQEVICFASPSHFYLSMAGIKSRSRKQQKQQPSSASSRRHSSLKELPHKAAKIRRTFPEPGVEKTELRFVLYNEPGGQYSREKFLREVADFFQEQARRLAESTPQAQEQPKPELKEQPKPCAKKAVCTRTCSKYVDSPEPGVILAKDVVYPKEPHHEQPCPRVRVIRTSMPVVKKLIDRVRELNPQQKNKELTAIHRTAQAIYEDAEKCLQSGGPIGDHIGDRIIRLREMATKVLTEYGLHHHQKKTTIVRRAAISSSSISNVKAASHADSSIKGCSPRRRQ